MAEYRRAVKMEGRRVEVSFEKPERPALSYTPPTDRGFGDRPVTLVNGFTHVQVYEGELYACDVCGAVVAKWPDDHPFQHRDGLDSFEVHTRWHASILKLESRR